MGSSYRLDFDIVCSLHSLVAHQVFVLLSEREGTFCGFCYVNVSSSNHNLDMLVGPTKSIRDKPHGFNSV